MVTLSLSDRPSRGQTHVNLTEGSFSNGTANSWTAEPQNEAICKSLAQRQKERESDRANTISLTMCSNTHTGLYNTVQHNTMLTTCVIGKKRDLTVLGLPSRKLSHD